MASNNEADSSFERSEQLENGDREENGIIHRQNAIRQWHEVIRQLHPFGHRYQDASNQQLGNVNQLSDTNILMRREGHSTEIESQGISESALNLGNYVDIEEYRAVWNIFL